jgi:hypothetical protein
LTGALLVHFFLIAKMARVRRVPMRCPTIVVDKVMTLKILLYKCIVTEMKHLPVRRVTTMGIQAGWMAAKEASAASSNVTKSWSDHSWLSRNLGLSCADPSCMTLDWSSSDE